MEYTKTVAQWLGGFEDRGEPTPDRLSAGEGWGIFPQGQQVVARWVDILGTEHRRVRMAWDIKFATAGVSDVPERLAQWALLAPPPLGERQTVALREGRLLSANAAGESIYGVQLVMEFDLRGDTHD